MSTTETDPRTCYACGMSFTVLFDDSDAEARFCPHCGQETVDDIELIENYEDIDSSILYESDDADDL